MTALPSWPRMNGRCEKLGAPNFLAHESETDDVDRTQGRVLTEFAIHEHPSSWDESDS